jgi:AcrR family transcriptional regulator
MAQRAPRRSDALSRERIVEVATRLLDDGGEDALTFRALTTTLRTGYGAIYHHVPNKSDLLAACTDDVVARVTSGRSADGPPREALRSLAAGLFDAIDAHPWVGGQLAREPWRPALLEVYESVGERLHALGVPDRALFDAAGALVNYVLGVAGQNAANARLLAGGDTGRDAFLAMVAARWTEIDPATHPFVHRAAAHLRDHDDREQFLAGVDLILAGIESL